MVTGVLAWSQNRGMSICFRPYFILHHGTSPVREVETSLNGYLLSLASSIASYL